MSSASEDQFSIQASSRVSASVSVIFLYSPAVLIGSENRGDEGTTDTLFGGCADDFFKDRAVWNIESSCTDTDRLVTFKNTF